MITNLRVQNFRSHADFSVDFSEGPTVITWRNGAGKTSLLEAVYLVASGKSWRSNFREIVKKNEEWFRIDAEFSDIDERTIKFIGGEKSFTIGEKSTKTMPKNSRIPVILFEPNDLMIIYGSPSRRRDFFDRFISQIEPDFSAKVSRFERILRQRNNLIKSGQASAENIFVWDVQFSELASEISRKRAEITEMLNQKITKNYAEISGEKHNNKSVKIKFNSDSLREKSLIFNSLSRDFANGFIMTKIGSQRDDYEFIFREKTAKTAASRGENRTLLFAILASFAEILNEKYQQKIFILLDDVDGELDDIHRKNLYQSPVFAKNYLLATTIRFDGKIANHIEL